jgi:asparagine synthase (glutamine-hydrolysing)
MCGIIGYINNKPISVDRFLLERDRMYHRGPDDRGFWKNALQTVLLGHRRLSIIDLTSSGHQPMVSKCGRYVIVFNGELYNYIELKKELEEHGHRFVSNSDSEVVLEAFIEWGEESLDRFNGMFAFGVWDQGTAEITSSLFLARDRAGKKPLYYAHSGRTLAFSSELKSIPKELKGGIDPHALNHYLALGYVPGSLCIVQGVSKLPPAHAARYYPGSGELRTWCWWSLPSNVSENNIFSGEELAEQSWALLTDAVKIRLRSDVPIGILLSGGLDSSLIVACAAQVSSQPVKTFTMGLPGSHLDESTYADLVAQHFSTEHHLLEINRPNLLVLDEIDSLVDEPIADSSLIPAYLLSKLTVEHVKVALGGDGGDELFGGYKDYTTTLADEARFGWVPKWFLRMLGGLAGQLPSGVRGRNRLYSLRGGPYHSMIWGSPYFDAVSRRRVLADDVVAELGEDFLAPEKFRLHLFNSGLDPVDSMTRTHFGSILPDDYLVKVDRSSMAVSLEMRCPFLDVRLVDFAFGSIPSHWKVNKGEGRLLQKQLAKRILPKELDINRKQGFSVPMDDWLNGEDMSWRDRIILESNELINYKFVGKLVDGQLKGRSNGARLFSLIMLSIAMCNLRHRQL